jgi:glyoxylase-like metal-dependent hydrolase (beta-lactamase superfamily II)
MNAIAGLPVGVTVFERGWLSSNNVFFSGGGCTAMVDTGYVSHAPQTLALAQGALANRPLDLILNTHLHSDHCGGNAILQGAYPQVRTFIPPGLAEAVRMWDEEALTFAPTGQHCARFRFDALVCPGEEIDLGGLRWQVHAAPGHDPHSVVLFEPASRTLISADALWEDGFGVVFPELEGAHAFDEVSATLDVVESLRPLAVIPGHGNVFGGEQAIGESLSRARSRLAKFAKDPTRHAAHGVKVLIKFRLLEWQAVELEEFWSWSARTPYVGLVHQLFFSHVPMREWLEDLISQLIHAGAAIQDNRILRNI